MNYKQLKRFSDFIASLLFLFILSPIFLIISVLIAIQDGRPIFYTQKRIGLNGKYFMMYKFRTMIKNADKDKLGYLCFEGDKRITNLGRIFRKYSLDELPQLLNIMIGNMSFVGPRPAVFDEFERENLPEKFQKYIKIRTEVKPGLTGFVQIHGRNELSWEEKLVFDKVYINKIKKSNINYFLLDFLIIIKTFFIVFSSKGEYDK